MDKHDFIDNYFEGNLSSQELLELNQMLGQDVSFAAEFAFQKEIRKSIHLQERAAIKNELKSYKKQGRTIRFRTLLAAAAVLIFGAFTWIYINSTKSNTDLYTAYYQSFPNVVNPIVRGESVSSEAFLAYEKEDFKSAEALFSAQFNKDHSDYSYFYWGVCLLQNNKTEKAINHFEKASYDSNENWADYSKWYLALAYIKTGKIDKAKPILEKLASKKGGFMYEKAAELLLKL
jgi:tetratricopeptide (TPR) repeat protein